ncbi:MAG TPA: alanine racemase [Actinomycetota bacterium]
MSILLQDLDTPCLTIDLDVLAHNVQEMAGVARDAGVRLRPHTKTHKAPEIARMQIAAGASGITVAKLGEAEVMADAGLEDLLIAYPIVGERKLERLGALLERASVRVSLDAVEVAEAIGRVGREAGRDVPVRSRSILDSIGWAVSPGPRRRGSRSTSPMSRGSR